MSRTTAPTRYRDRRPVGGFLACPFRRAHSLSRAADRRRFEDLRANRRPVDGGDATCHVCGASLQRRAPPRRGGALRFCQAGTSSPPMSSPLRQAATWFRESRSGLLSPHQALRYDGHPSDSLLWNLAPGRSARILLRRVVPASLKLISDEAPRSDSVRPRGPVKLRARDHGRAASRRRDGNRGSAQGAARRPVDARQLHAARGGARRQPRGSGRMGPHVLPARAKNNGYLRQTQSCDYLRSPGHVLCVRSPHDLKKAPDHVILETRLGILHLGSGRVVPRPCVVPGGAASGARNLCPACVTARRPPRIGLLLRVIGGCWVTRSPVAGRRTTPVGRGTRFELSLYPRWRGQRRADGAMVGWTLPHGHRCGASCAARSRRDAGALDSAPAGASWCGSQAGRIHTPSIGRSRTAAGGGVVGAPDVLIRMGNQPREQRARRAGTSDMTLGLRDSSARALYPRTQRRSRGARRDT